VFNFGDDFDAKVVGPYVDAHAAGRTPNPCIECNRHLKFDRLLRRSEALGIELVATGHHAVVVERPDGTRRIGRGVDAAKDQSYVLYMLGQAQLARLRLPVGHLTKAEVRAHAARLGLRTAAKPDSQDVCFITSGGRERFLRGRVPLTPGRVVDTAGNLIGTVPAVELVTVGQRKGLGAGGGTRDPRFAVAVDPGAATVTIGTRGDLLRRVVRLESVEWAASPHRGPVLAQTSAHGRALPGELHGDELRWREPQRRVAPGQSVVLYDGDEVLGGGIAAAVDRCGATEPVR
jgi:tRNA-specific 2-thiouridylase